MNLFDIMTEDQKKEIENRLRTVTEQTVETVFARHGFLPNQSDTAVIHNIQNTGKSAARELIHCACKFAPLLDIAGQHKEANELRAAAQALESILPK